MKRIIKEDGQLQLYLNKLLDELPLLEPSAGFTEKVMQAIDHTGPISATNHATSRISRWKRDALHGLVASAATFLFVSSGLWHQVLTINERLTQLPVYIEKISRLL